MIYDVAIAGAGVIGGMIARELTKYNLSVLILEKENDVAMGASKANSGIIHGGFDPVPNTLKAKLNVKGVPLLYKTAKELNVPFKHNGSIIVAFNKEEELVLEELYKRGLKNGVSDMEILSGEEAQKLEHNLSKEVTKALVVKSAGIICPYSLTIAAVGNAMDNGAELKRNFEILKIEKTKNNDEDLFKITSTTAEDVFSRYFINCAGGFADKIAEMLDDNFFTVIPRVGEYMLLDKSEGKTVEHTIFQVPTKNGKGILVTPTVHGNLLLGPTAEEVYKYTDTKTTQKGLNTVKSLAKKSVPGINFKEVITSFSGVRASEENGDFILQKSKNVKGLIHAAAIDSPGLSSCVAIAEYVVDILKEILQEDGKELTENKSYNGKRKDINAFKKMTVEEKNLFIKNNPSFGKIVCRCEVVSEGEILEALRINPKALDLDGVKRRVRAGMGRCQGGFCTPYILGLIAEELKIPLTEVSKKGKNSKIVYKEL